MHHKWHPSPKTAPLLSFTSHNEKVGKEGGARCKQGEGERVSKAADKIPSFPLIGLHRRKWFTALLSQFTLAVQIYARFRFTAATDLHQSHGLCLQRHQAAPFWRHLYFLNSFRPIVKCFRLRSRAGTFSQAMCEAALVKGLLGGFGCGALSGLTHKYRPAPLLLSRL